MEVEVTFPIIAAALCVSVVWLLSAGLGTLSRRAERPEPAAFVWLVAPIFGGLVVLALVSGWALQESEPSDEWVSWPLALAAFAAAPVVARAVVRSVTSFRAVGRARLPVATVGFLRRRCVVSDDYRRAVTPGALRAALAHEEAHARGHDPLRIWLARLAADLQWPVPAARRRLHAWLVALEMRRDDEAVAAGAKPTDLAEAILAAARLCARSAAAPVAQAGEVAIALRVRRLLATDRAPARPGRLGGLIVLAALALLAATWVGVRYGDALVGFLPGVCR